MLYLYIFYYVVTENPYAANWACVWLGTITVQRVQQYMRINHSHNFRLRYSEYVAERCKTRSLLVNMEANLCSLKRENIKSIYSKAIIVSKFRLKKYTWNGCNNYYFQGHHKVSPVSQMTLAFGIRELHIVSFSDLLLQWKLAVG